MFQKGRILMRIIELVLTIHNRYDTVHQTVSPIYTVTQRNLNIHSYTDIKRD